MVGRDPPTGTQPPPPPIEGWRCVYERVSCHVTLHNHPTPPRSGAFAFSRRGNDSINPSINEGVSNVARYTPKHTWYVCVGGRQRGTFKERKHFLTIRSVIGCTCLNKEQFPGPAGSIDHSMARASGPGVSQIPPFQDTISNNPWMGNDCRCQDTHCQTYRASLCPLFQDHPWLASTFFLLIVIQ